MSDKKQIDRLFQEKFKNFEATPNDAVWENINNRLHKDKRKRRIIPIWWKLGGVAAGLLLMLTVGNVIYNEFSSNKNTITTPIVNTNENSNETIVKNSDGTKVTTNKASDSDKNKSNSPVVDSDNTDYIKTINDDFDESRSQKPSNNSQNIIIKTPLNKNSKGNLVTNSSQNSNSNQKNKSAAHLNKKDAVANNASSNLPKPNTPETLIENTIVTDYLKSNSDTAIVENTKEEDVVLDKKEDEIKNSKTIEEAIAEANEDKEKEEEKLDRWSVTPNAAPVYFNTLGNGSSLDEQFANNSKSGDVNMSYGVGGSYAINKNLKIRAGINKVGLGYSTNDVISYKNIDATSISARSSHLNNVNVNASNQNTTFISSQTFDRNSTPEIINNKEKGSLDQLLGFIEVPLELEYAVINKKLGINVIGGFSTLIVDKNEVYSVVDGNKTLIGEANNVNDVSYSANVGLGINYKLSDKIKVNLEPTFKYQIKTFNNSSGDFQPYFIGVYTGLSFKF